MRHCIFCFLFSTVMGHGFSQDHSLSNRVIAVINGSWFNGQRFEKKTWYVANGLLSAKSPQIIDTVIDLANQFVVPPFGEAHNHSIDNNFGAEGFINVYLKHGIFYIKNPNSIPASTNNLKSKINKPNSVDIIYANGGLTATGGHPERLYKNLLARLKPVYPTWSNDSLLNQAYYRVDDKEDLEKQWSNILSQRPDFIKTYLLYSEEYDKRKNDTNYFGRKGLSPLVLKAIVKKAKLHGLRVTTHIETKVDFHHAMAAGVDEVNHLPGYNMIWRAGFTEKDYLLDESDVRLAAKNKASVVATYSLLNSIAAARKTPADTIELQKKIQRKNLELLKKYGVPITVGCDSYMETSRTEAMYLHELNVFTNLELLKMWCENTPVAIFPGRKIGYLREGYEASFLVLKDDPLKNFDNVKEITLRVKQGQILFIK